MSLAADLAQLCAVLAMAGYLAAVVPASPQRHWPAAVLFAAWLAHAVALAAGADAWGAQTQGLRLGFAPALSFTIWLVLAVHGVESRFLPLQGVRRVLAVCGALAVGLAWQFPGEVRAVAHSRWAPMHWVLGLASYGLFGAAVLHAVLLDTAERRLRQKVSGAPAALGMPLLKLERLTFRFVEAGFAVLTVALLLGLSEPAYWTWDHKIVLSLLGWATFAALIAGRLWQGWRGRQATRWVYAGAILLLLAYVGSRFVFEVVLHRTAGMAN